MKTKIFICLLLLAVSLGADGKPLITFTGNQQLGIYNVPASSFSTCDVCGRKIPLGLMFKFPVPPSTWDGKLKDEYAETMKPFTAKTYSICLRCILEALKIKPETAEAT
jgi:hypothetical protein